MVLFDNSDVSTVMAGIASRTNESEYSKLSQADRAKVTKTALRQEGLSFLDMLNTEERDRIFEALESALATSAAGLQNHSDLIDIGRAIQEAAYSLVEDTVSDLYSDVFDSIKK